MLTPGPGWFPLTPRGVAAGAHASWAAVAARALLAGSVIGLIFFWTLLSLIFPVVSQFFEQLPDGVSLSNRRMIDPSLSPSMVVEDNTISLALALSGPEPVGQTADLRVAFFPDHLRICGLVGCSILDYPGLTFDWNRSEDLPWWQAWRPFLGLGLSALLAVVLFLFWTMLGWLQGWLILGTSYFLHRNLTRGAAWKLGITALLPSALLLAVVLLLYSVGALDLVQLAVGVAAHLVLAWVYLVMAPFFLERQANRAANPFS